MTKTSTSPKPTTSFRVRVAKSWSSNSQDGKELRTYVECGFVDGYGINDILNKYPQFLPYDRKTVYNAVIRYRKKAEENLDARGNLEEGCKYYFNILI